MKCLPRSAVEGGCNSRQIVHAVRAQVRPLGEVLAEQTVGVFIRAALPGTVRVTEEDLQARVDAQLRMLSHLSTLVPGQGPTQLFGQSDDARRDGRSHSLGTVTREGRAILHPLRAVIRH